MPSNTQGKLEKQSQQTSTLYASENQELRKLHQQRIKRQTKKQSNQSDNLQEHQEKGSSLISKSIKKQEEPKKGKCPKNLLLNSLLSDQRNIKAKPNSIALSSLFQDQPSSFAAGISKNIEAVFITTYGYVMDVLEPIAQAGVPFALLNDSKENGEGKVERGFFGFSNMVLITPPRRNKGYGVFHTKLWLIRFKTFLRVVVCTGNQHPQDWLIWLNGYWYKDFPLVGIKIGSDFQKQQVGTKRIQKTPGKELISLVDQKEKGYKFSEIGSQNFNFQQDFKDTLQLVLEKMLPKDYSLRTQLGIDLDKYDYSGVDVVLIPSVPGRYTRLQNQMEKYGMVKVRRVLSQLGLHAKKSTLTYSTSSLGSIDHEFLRQLYLSFNPHAVSFSPTDFKIIYPSQKYIQEETCGEAQILFLKKQNYFRSELRKEVFYHYTPSEKNPVRGAIPHLKTVIMENLDQTPQGQKKCVFFMGSHNMTKAAWGTFEKGQSQISFSNSQLGVLFPRMEWDLLENWLPFANPPRKYGEGDKPCMFH